MRTTKIINPQDTNTQEAPEQNTPATDVYIWGSNHQGQLGLGNQYIGKTCISPRPWSFSMAIAQVSCGEDHTAFVTLRGQVYTLGSNLEGQLGLGSRSIKQSATPCLVESLIKFNCLQISCGSGHTAALMDSGDVFTWGVGEHGALGTGSIENAWVPEKVTIDHQNLVKIRKVSAGTKHTAFITDTGILYACGTGETGQLGTGKRDKELIPVHVSLISEKVRDVACGPFHTLILTERGKVYATGGNTLGQLGLGNKKSSNIPIRIKELDFEKIVRVACGHHSAALNERGEVFVWGTGVFGEALTPVKFSEAGIHFKEISLGSFFGTALDDRGSVWTWGANSNGELGLQTNEPRGRMTHNQFFDDKSIESLVCGGAFAIAIGRTSKVTKGSPRRSSLSPHRAYGQKTPTESYESPARRQGTPNYAKPSRGMNVSYDIIDGENPQDLRNGTPELDRLGIKEKGILKKTSHLRGVSMDRSSKSAKKETIRGVLEDSPGKSDQKRREDRAIMKESMVRTEDSLVELLVKQKNVLEKCLKEEREEKRVLEHSLKELKKRLRDLHDGPGGFSSLSEALNKQAKKFDELKQVYEEEIRRREKATWELSEERKVIREQNHTLIEKEEAILILKRKIEAVEAHSRDVSKEMEEMRQSMLNENRRLKQELDSQQESLVNLDRALEGSKVENVEKKNLINKLEISINRELEEKRELEAVQRALNVNLQEGKSQIVDLTQALHAEKETRIDLEKELEASMQREETCQAHARQLLTEVEHLRNVIEQNLINEHENNSRMLQDHDLLSQQLNEKEGETQELKAKIGALEQDLVEHQEKNKKLLGILSNEIEKQADEFKKKTYHALVRPAGKLAENIVRASKEGGLEDYETAQGLRAGKQRSFPDGSPLLARHNEFINQGENSFGSVIPTNWNNPERNTPIKGVESYYSTVREPNFNGNTTHLEGIANEALDLEKLRKELYEDKSTVESRMQGSPDVNKYGNLSRYEQYGGGEDYINEGMDISRSYRIDEGPRGSVKLNESRVTQVNLGPEDARTRLNRSANKLRSILDISDNEGNNQSEYMGKSMTMTPMREERKREPERILNSRGKSVSPIKNVPTFRDKEAGGQPTQDTTHLQSLREVKQRLEMLQRNKQALEDKMQDYEKKVKVGNH